MTDSAEKTPTTDISEFLDKEQIEKIKRNKVLKVMINTDFLFGVRWFFKRRYNTKFIIGRHHQIIAEALERVYRGQCLRLIIQVAPRFGKTEEAVISFIALGLALNAAAKFIHLSYSDELALENSEQIKDLVQHEAYQELFPEVQIKKDSKAKNKWWTTAGGGMLARSAAGSVTGFGAGHVDKEIDDDTEIEDFLYDGKEGFNGAIVIDDPIKVDDADSEVIRSRVNMRFDSTIRTRANSRRTPIILIMQRTHPNDLAGYLQRKNESDKWEVISLPVINPDGTALWPHKMTVEEANALRRANDLVFERQYMQNPKPKSGLMFPIEDLRFYDHDAMEETLSNPDFIYIPCDPAGDGSDDFAAGPYKLIGDSIYLTDVIYNPDGADLNEVALEKMIFEEKAMFVGVEGVFGWRETAKRIRESLDESDWKGDFRILTPRTNKHTRIYNRSSFIRNNIVFRSDWETRPAYAKFMRILTSYQKVQEPGAVGKHDDACDLCEMAGSFYEKMFPHLWALKPRETKPEANEMEK